LKKGYYTAFNTQKRFEKMKTLGILPFPPHPLREKVEDLNLLGSTFVVNERLDRGR
jgi:hypothetical protein